MGQHVAGRDFAADESRFGTEPAVIVNETLAGREVGHHFAAGIVIGLLASVLVGRSMRAILFGVEPLDPGVYAAVPVTIAGPGLLASIGPALGTACAEPARILDS